MTSRLWTKEETDQAIAAIKSKAADSGHANIYVIRDDDAGTVKVTVNGRQVFMGIEKSNGGAWIVRFDEDLFK